MLTTVRIGDVFQSACPTWVGAGLSLLFVAYLFWETVWRRQLKQAEERETW